MRADAGSSTDQGRVRQSNEDVVHVDLTRGVYLVCDGMGGHAHGEVAARTAADAIVARLAEHDPRRASAGEARAAAEQAVMAAARAVFARASSRRELAGMGTTATLLVQARGKLCLAHVGDSRLYLLRGGVLLLLSRDHTLGAELRRDGEARGLAVEVHAFDHVLTRSLGARPDCKVDLLLVDAEDHDTFLLCSDGVGGYIDDDPEHFRGLLAEGDAATAAEAVVRAALEAGGHDNASAVVVRVSLEDDEERALAQTSARHLERLRHVPVLDNLGFGTLQRLLNLCEERSLAAGEAIFQRGKVADALVVVCEGALRVSRDDEHSGLVVAGQALGEDLLLAPREARADVVAAEPSRVLVLPRDRLAQLLEQRPPLGMRLMQRLGERVSRELDRAWALLASLDHRPAAPSNPGELL